MNRINDRADAEAVRNPMFTSELLTSFSELVNRWTSYRFQTLHATRLDNELDFSVNKVLYILGTTGACRPSALATQLATGRANVSKVIGRLESLGLVSRAPDPHDSRAFLIALTPAGTERSHDVFRIGDDMLREMTAEWEPGELETFSRLVGRFNLAAAAYEHRLAASIGQVPENPSDATSGE